MENSSLAPELLTVSMTIPSMLATQQGGLFVRADYLASRLLSAISRAPGFSTYVVDARASVFAHADPGIMAAGRPVTNRALVEMLLG